MLQNTFVHIPRITRNAEINLWTKNIHSWNDVLDKRDPLHAIHSIPNKNLIVEGISKSIEALKKKQFNHFQGLPSNQHWRLYSTLKDNACFLDIETTGLSKHHNDITLIGIHSNDGTKIFMKDKNLEKFENELKKYSMIITFNGKCFDVPFIKTKFPEVNINQYHADLRFIMAELGYRGGLKSIENQRGINRAEELDGVDGFEAVRLWHRYQRGDNNALATLKSYLTADVENLRTLMNQASVEMKQKYFYDVVDG